MTVRKRLPKGWRWVNLGDSDVAQIGAGNSAPQGSEFFEDGIYPFVRTQDVGREHQTPCLTDTTDRLNDHALQTKKLKLWPEFTILIPKSGASTFLNHRAMLGCPAYVSSHLATVVARESASPEYLYFFLLTVDAKVIAPRSNYPSLRLPDVAGVKIALPPMAEQERIVDVLRKADAIRRKRAEARRLADQIISSAFMKYFATAEVKQRTLGSLLVSPPQYGTSKRANSLGDGDPVLRIPNVLSGELDISDLKYVPGLTEKEKKKWLVTPGDILLVRTNGNRDYVGRCCVVPDVLGQEVVFASYLMRLRPDPEAVLPEYLDAFLRTEEARAQMLKTIPTSAGNYNINAKNLSAITIPVPAEDVQQRFVHIIERHRIYFAKALQSETEQNAFFNVLLSHAFTGELTAECSTENGGE